MMMVVCPTRLVGVDATQHACIDATAGWDYSRVYSSKTKTPTRGKIIIRRRRSTLPIRM